MQSFWIFFFQQLWISGFVYRNSRAMEVIVSSLKSYRILPTLLLTYGFITNSPYVYGDGILQVSNPILDNSLSFVCNNIACRSQIEASVQCERDAECRAFHYNPETAFCPMCKCGDYSTRRSFSPAGQVLLRLFEVETFIPGDLEPLLLTWIVITSIIKCGLK